MGESTSTNVYHHISKKKELFTNPLIPIQYNKIGKPKKKKKTFAKGN